MKHSILTSEANLITTDTSPYVSFNILEQFPFIRHGFSTRLGGVSKGIFESMNLGFNRGDTKENVMENYRLLCESIGINHEELVFTDQVHKAKVRVATAKDKGMGILRDRTYQEIDGHITNERKVPLLVFSADCVPIFFVDPVKKAIGLTHSGWKGTKAKIGKVTVEEMEKEYGCKRQDIIAVIGPCICKKCYEVSEDVFLEYEKNFTKQELDLIFTKHRTMETNENKYQLSLWEANRILLEEAGLTKEHVVLSKLCTMCQSELFFSHRATKGQRGSMAGFLSLV